MYITGLGTATPSQCYTQGECLEAFSASDLYRNLSARSQTLLKKILGNGSSGIYTRHLALDPLQEFIEFNPDALYRRFLRHAPALASESARRALADARLHAGEIDAVIVSTCTGYLCPGLSSYVVERLSLRKDVTALDLVGHGCGAALPNLQTAEVLLAANNKHHTVLSICVEICTAAFYLDDDPGVLISACLFGDGAAAAVLQHGPLPGRRSVRWQGSHSVIVPAQRDLLRFEQRDGMLRNILTPPVPQLAARHADEVLASVLSRHHLQRGDIGVWIWHTGGRDVLNALEQQLQLQEPDMRWSREILNEYGNMSSPSVLFVLQRALHSNAPPGWWWMSSFGAGFSSHGALLEVGAGP